MVASSMMDSISSRHGADANFLEIARKTSCRTSIGSLVNVVRLDDPVRLEGPVDASLFVTFILSRCSLYIS